MSKRHDVMLALKALTQLALPLADLRGFGENITPRPVGAGGSVVGHPGDPGNPEVDLSPLIYHFDHVFRFEFAPPSGTSDTSAALDEMLGRFGAAIVADRTLGGLCDFVEAGAPLEDETPVIGAETQRWALVEVTASYSTADPLG